MAEIPVGRVNGSLMMTTFVARRPAGAPGGKSWLAASMLPWKHRFGRLEAAVSGAEKVTAWSKN